jgi:hypothetical protein
MRAAISMTVMANKKTPSTNAALLAELRKMSERQARLEAKLEAMRTATTPKGALSDADIKIGLRCAALIGPRKYAAVEVTGWFANPATGAKVYELRRLDGARKGVGLTPASKLYPESFAPTPSKR